MCKLDFTIPADSNNGVLSPNDLRFFYYDIGLDNLSGIPVVYEENEEANNFIISKHLTIDTVEKDLLPAEYQEGSILFTTGTSDKSKMDALFRHLRNAFSHYRINRCGDYFLMKDYNQSGTMTMIGKIKCDDFFEYCYLLFKQREKFSNNQQTV